MQPLSRTRLLAYSAGQLVSGMFYAFNNFTLPLYLGHFTSNAELAWVGPIGGDTRGSTAQLQANLAVGYHLRRWLQPELEVNYQATLGPPAHVLALTAGVVLPWGEHRIVVAAQQTVATWNAASTTGAVLAYKRSL